METVRIIYIILTSVLALIIIVGNALVLISIATQSFLRTPPNLLIGSLAVVDAGLGLYIWPMGLYKFLHPSSWRFSPEHCDIERVSVIIIGVLSLYHLVGIATDRYCTISFGLPYIVNRTHRKVIIGIGLIWVFGCIIGFAPLYNWVPTTISSNNNTTIIIDNKSVSILAGETCQVRTTLAFNLYVIGLGAVIPLTTLLIIYIKMYMKLKKLFKEREKLFGTKENDNKGTQSGFHLNGAEINQQAVAAQTQEATENSAARLSKERKMAKMLGLIVSGFCIGWLPPLFVITAFLLITSDKPPPALGSILVIPACCSCAINPFIYTYFSPEFRKGFKNVFGRIAKFCRK